MICGMFFFMIFLCFFYDFFDVFLFFFFFSFFYACNCFSMLFHYIYIFNITNRKKILYLIVHLVAFLKRFS